MPSYRKKSRRRIWLTKWDKVKAHDTLIDWCTGREWPLNYMTILSAWWRSNMPFHRLSGRLSGRLNYYITRWRQKVRSWRSERSQTSVLENATARRSGPPIELVIRWVTDKPAKLAPGPPVEHQENEKDTTLMAIRMGVYTLQSLFSLQLPLTRKPYYKWVMHFFKKSSPVFIIVSLWFFLHESAYEYIPLMLNCIDWNKTV